MKICRSLMCIIAHLQQECKQERDSLHQPHPKAKCQIQFFGVYIYIYAHGGPISQGPLGKINSKLNIQKTFFINYFFLEVKLVHETFTQ